MCSGLRDWLESVEHHGELRRIDGASHDLEMGALAEIIYKEGKAILMEVKVINNQIERSIRELKRMLIREGVFKELKKRRYYHKPSVRLKMKREDAEKTRHKDRKRAMARARAIL